MLLFMIPFFLIMAHYEHNILLVGVILYIEHDYCSVPVTRDLDGF
jgi:hypothetical protein